MNIQACAEGDPRGVFDRAGPGEDLSALASGINFATKATAYGTAGPAFVRGLIGLIERTGREKFEAQLCQRLDGWINEHCGDERDPLILRPARRFAYVAVAGELAAYLGVLPWELGFASRAVAACFAAWRSGFRTAAQTDDELVQQTLENIQANAMRFNVINPAGTVREATLTPHYGYAYSSDPAWMTISLAFADPTQFRKALCPDGDAPRALAALSAAGRLEENDKKRHVLKASNGNRFIKGAPMKRAIAVRTLEVSVQLKVFE